MKDSVSIQILQDIQTAWNTLNPQLIIKHLDKSFYFMIPNGYLSLLIMKDISHI